MVKITNFPRKEDGLLQVPVIRVVRNQVLKSGRHELAAVVGVGENQVLDFREPSRTRELLEVGVIVGLDVDDVLESLRRELGEDVDPEVAKERKRTILFPGTNSL